MSHYRHESSYDNHESGNSHGDHHNNESYTRFDDHNSHGQSYNYGAHDYGHNHNWEYNYNSGHDSGYSDSSDNCGHDYSSYQH